MLGSSACVQLTHTHTYTHTHAHTHTHTHTRATHTHTHAHRHTRTATHTHVLTHPHTYSTHGIWTGLQHGTCRTSACCSLVESLDSKRPTFACYHPACRGTGGSSELWKQLVPFLIITKTCVGLASGTAHVPHSLEEERSLCMWSMSCDHTNPLHRRRQSSTPPSSRSSICGNCKQHWMFPQVRNPLQPGPIYPRNSLGWPFLTSCVMRLGTVERGWLATTLRIMA